MKKRNLTFLVCLTSLCFCFSANAQKKPQRLPMDNKLAFEKFLTDVYNAYYEAFDKKTYKNFSKFFSGNAAEIGPDGRLTYTLKTLKEVWAETDKMMDEKPSFKNKLTSSRMVNSEIAIITWDSEADVKIQGKQMGGMTTCMAVLKKSGESWVIEFDSATPAIPMPEMPPPPPPPAAPPAEGQEK